MEIFVTGSTGLLGQKFMTAVFSNTKVSKAYLLVRDVDRAKSLLKQVMRNHHDKIEFLLGDISKKNFGLVNGDLKKLKNIETFYHLAALVHLGTSDRVKEKLANINHKGTKHSLELIDRMPNLEHFVFVSTAYSAGVYGKKIPETWLENPKSFRNHYEESKFNCERLIKEKLSTSDIHYSIVRPSILLDTPDNPAVSKHTIYLFSKFMSKYSAMMPRDLTLVGNLKSTLNFVFVDDLIPFVLAAGKTHESKIYNFVNEDNMTVSQLLSIMKSGLAIVQNIHFIDEIPSHGDNLLINILEKVKAFNPYTLHGSMDWSRKNTAKLLEDHNLQMKGKEDIVLNLENYCKYLRRSRPLKLKMVSGVNKFRNLFKSI